MRLWTCLLCLASMCGCSGGDDTIYAADYDQTCTQDGDCVAVQEGNPCCGCPNAAINRRDLERYRDDYPDCDSQCDIGCLQPTAFCDAGKCAVRQMP